MTGSDHAEFNPNGTQIVTASDDNTAKVWNAQTGVLMHTLQHAGWVYHAEFNPNGTQIVTASWDTTAKLWDIKELEAFYATPLYSDQLYFLWWLEQKKEKAKDKKTMRLHPDLLVALSTFTPEWQASIVKKFGIINAPQSQENAKKKNE